MSVLNNSLLLSPGASTSYTIPRSLRFNAPDSAYLSRTPSVAGNRKTWTWAGWVKRSALGTSAWFFGSYGLTDSTYSEFYFDSSDRLHLALGYTTVGRVVTASVYRDTSAWYHVVFALDATQSTAANKLRLYVNGVEITAFTTDTRGNLTNTDWGINSTQLHKIGGWPPSTSSGFNGLLADIHFIDGQALTPSSFGEFDANGIWQPRAFSGSYGTNGFHLPFSDNSAATAAALGKDTSGNNNNWMPNNLSVETTTPKYSSGSVVGATYYAYGSSDGSWNTAFDSSLSTGVFTYATNTSTITLSGPLRSWSSTIRVYALRYSGDLIINGVTCTAAITGGTTPAWYNLNSYLGSSGTLNTVAVSDVTANYVKLFAIELDGRILVDSQGAGNDSLVDSPTNGSEVDTGSGGQVRGNYCTLNPLDTGSITLANGNLDATFSSGSAWNTSRSTIWVSSGKWYWETTIGTVTAGQPVTVGVCQSSLATSSYIGANSTSYGYYAGGKRNNGSDTAYGASFTSGDVIGTALDLDAGTITFYKNGSSQGQAFSGLSGIFAPAISLYVGQTSSATVMNFGARSFAYTAPSGFKALNTANLPAPVVTKPNTVMDVKLITANNSTQAITGLGFSPDLVWTKSRSQALSHYLYDTVRGATKLLISNATNAESTISDSLISFDSTGFTLGANDGANYGSGSSVAWCWDAGSSTVTNTQGSITSSVRANPTAGFSIVSYSNGTTGSTIGHGLGVKPEFIIVKRRSASGQWTCYHSALGATKWIALESTAAAATNSGAWNNTEPTSSVFTVGSYGDTNGSGGAAMIAYCFAPVAGYSSFGSYTGNGSATDGPFVYTGMRPKWILVKRTDAADDWPLMDTVRTPANPQNAQLWPNFSTAESNPVVSSRQWDALSNGFKIRGDNAAINFSGGTYIYCAFAESPFQYARAR